MNVGNFRIERSTTAKALNYVRRVGLQIARRLATVALEQELWRVNCPARAFPMLGPSVKRRPTIAGDLSATRKLVPWHLADCRGAQAGDPSPHHPITLGCACLRPAPVTKRSQGHSEGIRTPGISRAFKCFGSRVRRGFGCWCREGELNPQGAKHRRILSPLRLPVPPSRLRVGTLPTQG